MPVAYYYLAFTLAVGVGLWLYGSTQWAACIAIAVGLVLSIAAHGASWPYLSWLTIWVAVSVILVIMKAPILAVLFCALSATCYLGGLIDVDGLTIARAANVFGVGMVLAVAIGGWMERQPVGAGDRSFVDRALHPGASLPIVRAASRAVVPK